MTALRLWLIGLVLLVGIGYLALPDRVNATSAPVMVAVAEVTAPHTYDESEMARAETPSSVVLSRLAVIGDDAFLRNSSIALIMAIAGLAFALLRK